MQMYDKNMLSEKAKELHVVKNTFEKVCRLCAVLKFFDSSELLRDGLALKGGTAINVLFFNLPRLSVDIDLDYCHNISRDGMMTERTQIGEIIRKHMKAEGYTESKRSKFPHSLDSFVFDYVNSGGMKDNIKIEINYSLRSHVFPVNRIKMPSEVFGGGFEVNTVDPKEIYASKMVALLTRAAARDLYDINYMVSYGLFDSFELEKYRKCVVFYMAVATETPPTDGIFFASIETITPHKIKTDLKPVVRDRDVFELDTAKKKVKDFLCDNIVLTENEKCFLKFFKKGIYKPELVFEDAETLERIKNHPMALWKTAKNRDIDAR